MKRLRVPLSYPASGGFDGADQATCRGGSVAVESVAAFAWNGWQASSGISGNLGLEYATRLANGEIWLLVIYKRAVKDNIPAHILKSIREVLENE